MACTRGEGADRGAHEICPASLRFAWTNQNRVGMPCIVPLHRVHVTVETAPFLFVFLSKRNKSPLPSFYDSIIQPKMPLRPGPERGASRLPTQAINGLEDLCVCAGPTQVPNHARGQDDVIVKAISHLLHHIVRSLVFTACEVTILVRSAGPRHFDWRSTRLLVVR